MFLESELQFPLYQPWNVKYYETYWLESKFKNCSFVIEEGKTPIIGLFVTYDNQTNGPRRLSCFKLPILYIENATMPHTRLRGARKALKAEWRGLIENYQVDLVEYQDFAEDGWISFFGQHLLNEGALVIPCLTQVINLLVPETELYGKIRKSYKSLINWGKRNLLLSVLDSETVTIEDIDSFGLLHFNAAGIKTRSHETWDLQYEMISHRESFAVLGELDGKLVTAALFPYSPKYCYYGVSAANRDLFEKPLSHAIMWKAIQYAKELGCCFFELGPQYYPKQNPEITQKELSISAFKHGFGGRTHVRLDIVWRR